MTYGTLLTEGEEFLLWASVEIAQRLHEVEADYWARILGSANSVRGEGSDRLKDLESRGASRSVALGIMRAELACSSPSGPSEATVRAHWESVLAEADREEALHGR
jgi:hypothetical protein